MIVKKTASKIIHKYPIGYSSDVCFENTLLFDRLQNLMYNAACRFIHSRRLAMDYLGKNVAKLGFGLMRLPSNDGVVDINQTIEMTDLFLDSGFTYFDTAHVYGDGKSEEALKTALVDRHPREKYLLATKVAPWEGPMSADEAKAIFFTQLERIGVQYLDYYLLHNLGQTRTKYFYDYGMFDYLLELKQKGLIRHIGFSMHDRANTLDDILTKHPEMEFVQLQLNYADWECGSTESRKCYETARKHNKPIVVMEPVKGGMLADMLVPDVKTVFDEARTGASYASWAIRFAASLDGIITVLSGMSTIEQMRDNVSYMKDFKKLSAAEYAVIEKARAVFASIPSIPCTGCEYCASCCPKKILISKILELMNRELVFGNAKGAKGAYSWWTQFTGKGSDCIKCGKCEESCPQRINIMDRLEEAATKYE